MKQIVDALAADGVFLSLHDGVVKAGGDAQTVNKWLPMLREHKPELIRWLTGRQILEGLAMDHPLDDLLDWYADDVAEFGAMEPEHVACAVRDYVENWQLYRNSGG